MIYLTTSPKSSPFNLPQKGHATNFIPTDRFILVTSVQYVIEKKQLNEIKAIDNADQYDKDDIMKGGRRIAAGGNVLCKGRAVL